MAEARARVFWGRIDRVRAEYHARWGVRDRDDPRPVPEMPDTRAFASHEDARDFVHLSACQAGFSAIAWDADSCPAPAPAAD